jgi:hypothetical protein
MLMRCALGHFNSDTCAASSMQAGCAVSSGRPGWLRCPFCGVGGVHQRFQLVGHVALSFCSRLFRAHISLA